MSRRFQYSMSIVAQTTIMTEYSGAATDLLSCRFSRSEGHISWPTGHVSPSCRSILHGHALSYCW